MNKVRVKVLTILILIFGATSAFAQGGTYNSYSPYSVYGVGQVLKEGNAYTRTMGGIGIATRNKRFLNLTNPAAVTARDSLSFMADIGISENNIVYTQKVGDEKYKSAHNTFNIANFALSFPIWKSSAFMVGIAPYSDVGYDFSSIEYNPDIIGHTNNISYNSYGSGGVYQIFAGAGVTFWKRLSLGAEFIYYFGTVDKVTNTVFSDGSYRSVNAGYETQIRSYTGKFGIQYEQRLWGDVYMNLGATYKPKAKVGGTCTEYSYAVMSELADTLMNKAVNLRKDAELYFGDEIGVGLNVRVGDKLSLEFNYLRGDWRGTNLESTDGFKVYNTVNNPLYTSTVSNSYRAGFEYVPNRNDIRYYHKKISYRGGIYYETENYLVSGNSINTAGITLGVTLPVFRWYNGLSVGVDFGQRGRLLNENLVRERYATILVGFNLHDIWFQKHQYH